MAELIDKGTFIKWFKENYELEVADEDTGEVTEYDRWISSVDYIDAIERFPTVTEAEIRNKVIDEFAEKLKRYMENTEQSNYLDEINKGNCNYSAMPVYDAVDEIAEQLKGE